MSNNTLIITVMMIVIITASDTLLLWQMLDYFFLFFVLHFFTLFLRASSPRRQAWSTWNFNTRLRMVSVLIATRSLDIWPMVTKLHGWIENGTRHPYLSETWRRLTAVAATVCPRRHIGGGANNSSSCSSITVSGPYGKQRKRTVS